jgi:hypothetical protein
MIFSFGRHNGKFENFVETIAAQIRWRLGINLRRIFLSLLTGTRNDPLSTSARTPPA